MKTRIFLTALALAGLAAPGNAADTAIRPMPAQLETRFALSALPPSLRAKASVYLLDPKKGYALSRQGTSGIECLVERTAWEHADFRNDIYIPLCYDAAGLKGHFKAIIDTAALRAQGMSADALKAEMEKRWANGTYQAPGKPGLSYMVSPVMRTSGPPDLKVHTMAMPHLMFYASNLTNDDIGAAPNFADWASLLNPFVDRQGHDAQSYMIQMIGETEKAKILADEKQLLHDLCVHHDVLCLPGMKH